MNLNIYKVLLLSAIGFLFGNGVLLYDYQATPESEWSGEFATAKSQNDNWLSDRVAILDPLIGSVTGLLFISFNKYSGKELSHEKENYFYDICVGASGDHSRND
jgi:hypothetical protein